jgi:hypothetical protein
MSVRLDLHTIGACVFAQHPHGIDIWVLTDSHHLPVLEPRSGYMNSSPGLRTPSAVSVAGWGLHFCHGASARPLPAGPVTVSTAPESIVPDLAQFNDSKVLRPDLLSAVPNDLPTGLTSMVRLGGGELRGFPCWPSKRYGRALWTIPCPDGTSVRTRISDHFQFSAILDEPVTVHLTRGRHEEAMELTPIDGIIEVWLTIQDVNGHRAINDDDKRTAYMDEWQLLHQCYEVPTLVRPHTDYIPKVEYGPMSIDDTHCAPGLVHVPPLPSL